MGTALSDGLIRSGIQKSQIVISRDKNKRAARAADIIFLCVKPAVVDDVLQEIKKEIQGKVVVSAAAALSLRYLKVKAKGARVARIMPNLPVRFGEGVVGLLYGTLTSSEKDYLKKIMSGLGLLVETQNDAELDALTLLSGCGPGIVAFLIDSLAESAARIGVKRSAAEMIVFQVCKGTLAHMEEEAIPAHAFTKSVATKGGVTEAILEALAKKNFKKTFGEALSQGYRRIKKISH